MFSKQQALGYYTIDAKGPERQRHQRFAARRRVQAAELQTDGRRQRHRRRRRAAAYRPRRRGVSVRRPAAGRQRARVRHPRSGHRRAQRAGTIFGLGVSGSGPRKRRRSTPTCCNAILPLDAQGKASLDVPVPADLAVSDDLHDRHGGDRRFASIGGRLQDVSRAAVGCGDRIEFRRRRLGRQADADSCRSSPTPTVARSPGAAIHLELQKMTYTSATQEVEGGESAQQAVKYETVDTADATSGEKAVAVNLTPRRCRAVSRARQLRRCEERRERDRHSSLRLRRGRSRLGAVRSQRGRGPARQEVVRSRRYGDGAGRVAVAEADVYFAVVRGDVLYRTTCATSDGAARVSFKIMPDMLPNAAVEAVVVRRGPHSRRSSPESLDTLARVGMAAFDVDVADRYLNSRSPRKRRRSRRAARSASTSR